MNKIVINYPTMYYIREKNVNKYYIENVNRGQGQGFIFTKYVKL
jgi:hypothetical protein